MIGTARLAAESACRTRSSITKQLSRLLKMRAVNSAMGTPQTSSEPPLSNCQAAGSQSALAISANQGQDLGLPRSSFFQSQPSGAGQASASANAKGAESNGLLQTQSIFPFPPLNPSRSYASGFPSLVSSTPSIQPRNYSTDAKGPGQGKGLSEQPQAKRNLNSGAEDSKKLCPETRWSGREYHATSSMKQQQMRDRSSEVARAKRPDMKRFRRRWRSTPLAEHHKLCRESEVEVSVLCYNVLAQCLIESNSYLYEDCPWDILRWEYRKRNLLTELKAANADIMCLQEVQARHFQDFFSPELDKLGYSVLYQKRTGDKHDGCAIFYKRSKLELMDYKRVQYYRPNIRLLDRDNVGVVALLRPTGLGDHAPRLCIANTHLLYNPKRGDIKLAQLGLLLAEIDRMAAVATPVPRPNPAYHPILLCGDFNSLPQSPLYNFIRNSRLDYVGVQKVMVSGQETGRRSLDPLDWPLWPYDVGVTDACQFRSVVRERLRKDGNEKQESQAQSSESSTATDELPEWDKKFSDRIHHPFNLTSVHCHDNGLNEVTTNHSRTNCMVDYIFFSSAPKKDREGAVDGLKPNRSEGELKLLGYRALMTDQEAKDMGGLPNQSLSSDHFSLQAKFLLSKAK